MNDGSTRFGDASHAGPSKQNMEPSAVQTQVAAATTPIESALRSAEERLLLANAAGLGFIDHDIASGSVAWDARVRELWGVAKEAQATEALFKEGVHPEDRDTLQRAWDTALDPRGGGRYSIEFRVIHSVDGSTRWIAATGTASFVAGRAIRMISAVRVTERRAVEAALRRRERDLQSLADNTPDVLTRFDSQLRHVFVNAAVEKIVGLKPAAFLGKTHREMGISAEIAAPWEAAMRRVFATGQVEALQFEFETPKGPRYYASRLVPEYDSHGAVEYVLSIAQDVSEARHAEQALRASEERLRLATDAAGLGIWIWYPEEDRVAWENERPYEIFGIPLEDHPISQARFLREFLHKDDAPAFERAVAHTLATGERFYFRGRIQGAHGGLHWLELTGSLHAAQEGSPLCMIGTAANVTEHQQREAQARSAAEANAKFRTMFEQGMQFAGILSLDGTVVEANRLCVDGCGFTREQIIGRVFWECGWWNRSKALMALVHSASLEAAQGRLVRVETQYFLADGSERFVDLTLAPVTDDLGKVLFVVPTGNDITDRRRAEAELREANRRKDEFLATLAHELRNPLAPIRTGLEVIKQAPANSAAAMRARDVMERQLGHMVRLVDDLLDVSRIARGKVELRKQRVELRVAIENAIETSAPAIAASHHELEVELPDTPIWIDADLTRIAQALSNILSNAAKYTADGGRIRITASEQSGMALIRVTDTGLGIPRAMLSQVFDMFAQVNKSDSGRSQGGLGIGLALVKLLVELHGGAVEAESEGDGRGSTFTVRLPTTAFQTDAESPAQRDSATSARSRKSQRILIVDDNVDGAELLATMLDLGGYETRIAHDGPTALKTARDFSPEVVFLDIGLPGMDGHEVARHFRADSALAKVVLIALTGWGSQEDKRRSKEAGFDFHLTKPVEIAGLNAVLAQCAHR
jgi:PAS domain S-box-containing protein